jgi:hypothetical protein
MISMGGREGERAGYGRNIIPHRLTRSFIGGITAPVDVQ